MNIEKIIEQTESYGHYHERLTIYLEGIFNPEDLRKTTNTYLCYKDGFVSYIKYLDNMAICFMPTNQEDYNIKELT